MTTITTPTYDRQLGIFDPAKNAHASVTFVGVGGIGSFAAFAVAKLGVPNLVLIDPDHVEAHNLPSQMYQPDDAGKEKVEALGDRILMTTGTYPGRWMSAIEEDGWTVDEENGEDARPGPLSGVVVSGLDSMTARADLWNQLRLNPRVSLYIDGRLDGQQIVIYALNPASLTDVEAYEKTLLSDDEVPAGVCTERAIIDVGFTVAAQIVRMVRLHFSGEKLDPITVINQKTNTIVKGEWLPL